jgi:hypothetical protein
MRLFSTEEKKGGNPFIFSPLTSSIVLIGLTSAVGVFMYYTDEELHPEIKAEEDVQKLTRKPTWYKKPDEEKK